MEIIMTDSKPLKVLVSAPLGVGGLTTMMINIQSHLDRKKINFDYLVFHDRKEPMEDTVYAMGSHKIIAAVDDLPIGFMRRICRVNEIRKVCKKTKSKFFIITQTVLQTLLMSSVQDLVE